MARRYGRNQKRQAREAIAQLEVHAKSNVELINWQNRKLDEYRSWADRVNSLVPRYSILNKKVAQEHRENDPGSEFDIANVKRLSLPDVGVAAYDELVPSHIERLRMNVMRISAHRDDYTRGQRFELLVGREGLVYYAVDQDYLNLNATSSDPDALSWASNEIARAMLNHTSEIKR